LDLLSADHRNLVSAEADVLVSAVTQHLTVERDLLYPAVTTYADDGEAIVEDLRAGARLLEERLAELEEDPSADHQVGAQAAIQQHIDNQRRLFPQLRESIPGDTLRELADKIRFSIAGSPTHPHPHLPDTGLIGELAEGLAGVADQLRDELHGEKRG
jgi:hypothetical protein